MPQKTISRRARNARALLAGGAIAVVVHSCVPVADPIQAAVQTIDVAPKNVSMFVGDIVQLTGTARDAGQQPLARTITWTSDHREIADVAADGTVAAHSPGVATITA